MKMQGTFTFALLLAALALAASARQPDSREFRFSRGGSDSIQYYYQDDDSYAYGRLSAQLPDRAPLD